MRLDVVPGESNLEADGIPRIFDGQPDAPTWLLVRGEDTRPDTSRPITPGVPDVLAFRDITITALELPRVAHQPERQPWVLDAHIATARRAVAAAEARQTEESSPVASQALAVAQAELAAVERRAEAMRAAWAAEDAPSQAADDPLRATALEAARAAARADREIGVAKAWAAVAGVSAKLATTLAKPSKQRDAAALAALEKELAKAREEVEKASRSAAEPGDTFAPLIGARWTPTRFKHSGRDDPAVPFPVTSTGRRKALAEWVTDPRNPLTARVVVNHVWSRHIGRPLVATVFDFGRKGEPRIRSCSTGWRANWWRGLRHVQGHRQRRPATETAAGV